MKKILTILAVSGIFALSGGLFTQNTAQAEAQEKKPEFGLFFVAPGVKNTYYNCIRCHSERIIIQQGLSREGWDEMLDWMIEDQGMGELDDLIRAEILDYLAAHYNIDRPNFPTN